MNWLDILLLLPLLIGLVRGLMRGLITEIIAIVAIILGIVGARLWATKFSTWLLLQFAWPEAVCHVVAYALLFLAIAIVLNIIGRLLSKLLRAIQLGFINRLLGGIFGTLKWLAVVLVVVFCLNMLDSYFHFLDNSKVVQTSTLYRPFVQTAEQIAHTFPNVADSVIIQSAAPMPK